MPSAIDLDAYFERIGHSGPRAADLETLRSIVRAHAATIPFENLDPFLGRPVPLDAASLERKLVRGGRGGYCYEHNLLLAHVLRSLGHRVTGLAARVVWNSLEGEIRPRTHMLLLVPLEEGPYIVDVGFGGLTLTDALRLEPGIEQPTPHEPFRLRLERGEYVLEAQVRGGWRGLYRFDLQEQHQVDYELTSWYLANHPQSRFVTSLIAARPAADRRQALLDATFTVHHLSGHTEQRVLQRAEELKEVLADVFGIALPRDVPHLDAALERIVAKTRLA